MCRFHVPCVSIHDSWMGLGFVPSVVSLRKNRDFADRIPWEFEGPLQNILIYTLYYILTVAYIHLQFTIVLLFISTCNTYTVYVEFQ